MSILSIQGFHVHRPAFHPDDGPNRHIGWKNHYPAQGGGYNIFGFERDFIACYYGDQKGYDEQLSQVHQTFAFLKSERDRLEKQRNQNTNWYIEQNKLFIHRRGNCENDDDNQAILIPGFYFNSTLHRLNYLLDALNEVLIRDRILVLASWRKKEDAPERLAPATADHLASKGKTSFALPLKHSVDY